jgi:hypothetical protein
LDESPRQSAAVQAGALAGPSLAPPFVTANGRGTFGYCMYVDCYVLWVCTLCTSCGTVCRAAWNARARTRRQTDTSLVVGINKCTLFYMDCVEVGEGEGGAVDDGRFVGVARAGSIPQSLRGPKTRRAQDCLNEPGPIRSSLAFETHLAEPLRPPSACHHSTLSPTRRVFSALPARPSSLSTAPDLRCPPFELPTEPSASLPAA